MKPKNPAATHPDRDSRRAFAYLEGELSPGERAAFKARAAADPRLAATVESCRALLAGLRSLPRIDPPRDFAAAVLASAGLRRPAWLRALDWLAGRGRMPETHPFDALADGDLPLRTARAVEELAARDPGAATALARWNRLHRQLAGLPRLAPSEGFADRVMAAVETPAPSAWRGIARRANPFPRLAGRRQRLAAACGAAFGSAAFATAIAYAALADHPLLTISSAASFARDRAAALLAAALDAAANALPAAWNAAAPTGLDAARTAGAAAILYGALALAAAWIIRRNLARPARNAASPAGSERAHVPA